MMAVDERARHQLHSKLEETLGPEEAAAMMDLLPPVGWAQVATKHDLEHLRALTKSDLDQHHAATKHDIAELRADTTQFRADTKRDIRELRAETQHGFAQLGSSLRQEIAEAQARTQKDITDVHKGMTRLTWSMTMALLTIALALVGLAIRVGTI